MRVAAQKDALCRATTEMVEEEEEGNDGTYTHTRDPCSDGAALAHSAGKE